MPKISRRSSSIISYKKNMEKPKIVANCLEIYSPATFAIGATENRRLNTGIKINLPESIIGALTTAPPSTKINQCQKITKKQKLVLHILNTSFTKTYFVRKNETIGLLVITNGNGKTFKHNVENL